MVKSTYFSCKYIENFSKKQYIYNNFLFLWWIFNKLMLEYAKCYKDKSRIYMIQNFLKTYDATQRREVPFKLFPRQQDLCKAWYR